MTSIPKDAKDVGMAGSTDPTDQCKALAAMIATDVFRWPPDPLAQGRLEGIRGPRTLTGPLSPWSPPERPGPSACVDDEPSREPPLSSHHPGCRFAAARGDEPRSPDVPHSSASASGSRDYSGSVPMNCSITVSNRAVTSSTSPSPSTCARMPRLTYTSAKGSVCSE